MKTRVIWHYTTADKLRLILDCGEIRPAIAGIDRGETPVVWFSTRNDWEPTATKMIDENGTLRTLSIAEMVEIGMVRIGVHPDTAPIAWKYVRARTGMSKETYDALARVARRDGAIPDCWYCSLEPVPADQWLAVQVYRDDEWQNVSPQ